MRERNNRRKTVGEKERWRDSERQRDKQFKKQKGDTGEK